MKQSDEQDTGKVAPVDSRSLRLDEASKWIERGHRSRRVMKRRRKRFTMAIRKNVTFSKG